MIHDVADKRWTQDADLGSYLSATPIPDSGGQVFNVRAYGAVGDGVTLDAAALDEANAIASTTGGSVYFPPGTYLHSGGFTGYPNVRYQGASFGSCILKLKSGSNADLMTTQSFASLTGTNTQAGPSKFTIDNLTIDGNKAGNSSGWPLRIYGSNYRIDRVEVQNGASGGTWTEWGSGGTNMEAHWSNFKIHDCAGDGLHLGGPHDSVFVNGQLFKNAGKSVYLTNPVGDGGAGAQLANLHVWGTEQTQGFYLEAVAQLLGCSAEGVPAGGYQITVLGNGTVVQGCRVFGTGATGGAAESGIQLGDASHFLTRCVIDATFANLNGFWFNFLNDTGRNIIRAAGTLGSGSVSTGTISNRTSYQWATEDTGAQDVFFAHRIRAGDSQSIFFDSSGSFTLFQSTGSGYMQMVKQNPIPAAPSANRVILFEQDNGSGKGQLCARFPSGAVQVIATEP